MGSKLGRYANMYGPQVLYYQAVAGVLTTHANFPSAVAKLHAPHYNHCNDTAVGQLKIEICTMSCNTAYARTHAHTL